MRQRWWNLLGHPFHPHGLIYSRVPADVVLYRFVHTLLIGVLSLVVHVLMLLVGGCVGKALLTDAADHRLVFRVHVHVALQVCDQTEGLATLGAAVTCHLGVHL